MIDNRVEKIRKNLEEVMDILEIERTNSNEDTPLRISKMWVNEIFANRNNNNLDELKAKMKVFDNIDNINELVVIKDIEFSSFCEHHWLPFSGKISVGYVPDKYIVGLSKVPRVVKYFSQKPQLQERLVKEVAEFLNAEIQPKCLFVMAEAIHTCVMCRGAESDCETNTIYKIGMDNELAPDYYKEFLSRTYGSGK